MKLLLFSLVLYLIGVAAVLYIRPQFMFRRDGSWKEFGVSGEDTSIFPIWMFCISWAVLTYALSRIIYTEPVAAAAVVASAKTLTAAPPEQASGALAQPGYYRLNESVMRKKGIPRYIYVGEETPEDLE